MLSFNSILDNETDKSSNKALNYSKNLLKNQTFADPRHPQGQEKKKEKGKLRSALKVWKTEASWQNRMWSKSLKLYD